ncbi:hypothetical protein QE152_g27258 [Popillia japonica]|uniref:Ribosomal protein S14 n=1 Tax=Popillia japonica TaxID=7064 RepID=A0AAW1JV02_POPJA
MNRDAAKSNATKRKQEKQKRKNETYKIIDSVTEASTYCYHRLRISPRITKGRTLSELRLSRNPIRPSDGFRRSKRGSRDRYKGSRRGRRGLRLITVETGLPFVHTHAEGSDGGIRL